ncbi:MAG: orotate phosphoribosyltransferase [Nanoarchaeota archaeon]
MDVESIERKIAKAGLEIKAIKLNPDNPFTWASGYRMPIYNDNRMFLWYPEHRKLIMSGFLGLMAQDGFYTGKSYDFIAGTSTSGIPWAEKLADNRNKPMVYVRDKPKDHGLKNQIEGIDAESNLQGKKGILIEDLISTGGSSVAAVQALRDANGICNHCYSIFNYGFEKAQKMFMGDEAFDKEERRRLDPPCKVKSLLTYDTLLQVAIETGRISPQQAAMLSEWRTDPFGWGEKRGFPKVEKK